MYFFDKLFDYLHYPFIRYAFIVGILISLCSSLFGVTLVLKRFSFIGDGLSHVGFGAMAIASAIGLTNQMFIVMPTITLSSILLLKNSQNSKIKGDALIALISVSSLALGYVLMHLFPSSSNISADVCSTLFGSSSILTLKMPEVILTIVVSVFVIGFFILFYNKIFSITFDENFAKATGIKVSFYNLVLAICIALIISLAMKLVGSLLISALIIFPSVASMMIFKNFKFVTIFSSIFSVFCTIFGLILSIYWSFPVGPTIVCFQLFVLIFCFALSKIRM